jgi:hypothetical protein
MRHSRKRRRGYSPRRRKSSGFKRQKRRDRNLNRFSTARGGIRL